MLDLTVHNNRFTLASIYGPNTDDPDFFKIISEKIAELENKTIIWCGDVNLVLNPQLDYKNYKTINNKNAREKLLDIINEEHLVDPYRDAHPELKRYTWRRKQPLQQARLDFFLVTEDLLTSIKKMKIKNSYRSDHSPVTLSLSFAEFIKGKPLWKFNNSLLNDIQYINAINKMIHEVKEQYSLPVYNAANLHNIPESDLQFSINDQIFLDTLLMEIRGEQYPTHLTKRNKMTKKKHN